MSEIEVKIIKLEEMRVFSAYGFGAEPEGVAWENLKEFGLEKGLFKKGEYPKTYGFNNPNPSQGSPNYGYEIWLPVADGVEPDSNLRVVNFSGGLYAATTFKGVENIGETWGKLVKWREGSKYKQAHHQWLEELTTGPDASPEEYVFTIYLPISE